MRQMIPIFAMTVALVMAAMGMLWAATAKSQTPMETWQGFLDTEEIAVFTALSVVTHVAAEANDQIPFWDAAVNSSAVSDDPVGTLFKLMSAADWAEPALAIWLNAYGIVNLDEVHSDALRHYANLKST